MLLSIGKSKQTTPIAQPHETLDKLSQVRIMEPIPIVQAIALDHVHRCELCRCDSGDTWMTNRSPFGLQCSDAIQCAHRRRAVVVPRQTSLALDLSSPTELD